MGRLAKVDVVSFFIGEGGMDHTFVEVVSPSDWGRLPSKENKRVCSKFDMCIIPLHECMFSLIDHIIPFNDFEESNHLGFPPS